MVDISPFRGLLYNKEKIKDYSKVISPPYDVISDDLRKKLQDCNPYNIVNLIIPGGNGPEKYSSSRDLLEKWIKDKALRFDNKDCYYLFEIGFFHNNIKKKMLGFIGLTRIEPYSSHKVLRHEKTLPEPKEDRYQLLKNCRTNFGLIYTLYQDPNGQINRILQAYNQKKPFIDIHPCYDRDLNFKLWKISDKRDTDKITGFMKDISILIADGHHRYETSLIYRDEHANSSKKNTAGEIPEDFTLTLFMESSQKDINICPTYRLIKFKKFNGIKEFLEKAADDFEIESVNIDKPDDITRKLKSFRDNSIKGFLFYTKDGNFYQLTFRKSISSSDTNNDPGHALDINILHHNILKKLDNIYTIEDISFTHKASRVFDDVRDSKSDLGIFLNAPTIKEMEEICSSGKLMPQKSTFFWPKPCSGLVIYKFEH